MIVTFEQDPSAPFGTGNFRDEAGRSSYTSDPQTASRFVATMPGSSAPTLGSQVASETADLTKGFVQNPGPTPGKVASLEGGSDPFAGDTQPTSLGQVAEHVAATPVGAGPAKPTSVLARLNQFHAATAGQPAAGQPAQPGMAKVGTQVAHTDNTSTTLGVDQAKIDARKQNVGAAIDTQAGAIKEAGQNATDRATQQADSEIGYQQGQVKEAQGDLSKNLGLQDQNQRKLSDLLVEKDPEVDQHRLMDNLTTGQTILITILTALTGGFAAASGQKGNPALDAINDAIGNDIKAQEKQIESGRIRRGNLIQEYRDRGMSYAQAIEAAKSTIKSSAHEVAKAEQQKLGASAANDQANLTVSQLGVQRAEQENNLDSLGDEHTQINKGTTRTDTSQVGTGTGKEAYEAELAKLKYGQAVTEQLNADQAAKIIGHAVTPDELKEIKTNAQQIGHDVAEVSEAQQNYVNYVEFMGGTVDKKTGVPTFPRDLNGVSAVRATDVPVPFGEEISTDASKLNDLADLLKESVTNRMTGANSNVRQDKTFEKFAGGSLHSESEVKANATALGKMLWAKQQSHYARDPDAARLYQYGANKGASSGGSGNVRVEE